MKIQNDMLKSIISGRQVEDTANGRPKETRWRTIRFTKIIVLLVTMVEDFYAVQHVH